MAYQLLCNSHPFGETDNKLQLMQRIISHAPIPPTKHNPGLPQEISELLGQLLSKNPDNRPANTHWLAAQCEKLSQLLLATSFAPKNNYGKQSIRLTQESARSSKI
jgi:serine/threonine-protein kinase